MNAANWLAVNCQPIDGDHAGKGERTMDYQTSNARLDTLIKDIRILYSHVLQDAAHAHGHNALGVAQDDVRRSVVLAKAITLLQSAKRE
jgi:hypothetical protein